MTAARALMLSSALIGLAPDVSEAQRRPDRSAPASDSASAAALEYAFAVNTSGVWVVDGEYKGKRGEYYKLSGYFGYVAATSKSIDKSDGAVAALYLEPMVGGAPTWIGARFTCVMLKDMAGTRCLPVDGASQLLELNLEFKTVLIRAAPAEAELLEPDEKGANRWTSPTVSRGRFTLKRP